MNACNAVGTRTNELRVKEFQNEEKGTLVLIIK